jgi:hypothetical protein
MGNTDRYLPGYSPFDEVLRKNLQRLEETNPDSAERIKAFQREQERREKEYEELGKIEELKSRKEFRRGLLKAVGIAALATIGIGFQVHMYGLHLNKEAKQQALEDQVRAERGYVVPQRKDGRDILHISIRRAGTSEDPVTTANYNGKNYLFKGGENGVLYLEPSGVKRK